MATYMKRFMLSLSVDVAERVNDAKRDIFDNKSYAELFRHLIALGLEAMEQEAAAKEIVSERIS